MGKATGFLEYERALPPNRPPLQRLEDYNEFRTQWSDDKASRQAARCMACGIPYCHMGLLIENAAAGCPINNLIPEFNDLIYRGRWQEALRRLMKTNNFPEFTGRVCPAPCEGSCTVGLNDPAVTIKLNECSIIDRAFAEGWVKPQPPAQRTGKKIAVVGSGPSGLACADQLNRAGHAVTVYERADRPGGLLMYGIPNMKLDKSIVLRRIKLMEEEGVTFVCDCHVGRDRMLAELEKQFDAVVLCTGATRPRDLKAEGRDLKGIHFAVDYLRGNTQALLAGHSPRIDARDKDVLIIGGGDTGTDCVGTALRQGCRSVHQLEIMPRPADTRQAGNPWPQWPKTLQTDYGQEEAAALTGHDPRLFLTTARKFIAGDDQALAAVETVQIEWQSKDGGRPVPVPQEKTAKTRPAQLVLLAMGFLGPEDETLQGFDFARDPRSNLKTASGGYQTSVPGIYAAGDARRGQSLVVWAIQEGRRAARQCDASLMGKSLLPL